MNVVAALLSAAFIAIGSANASTITFNTVSNGMSGGQPVSATATLVTGSGTVAVTLADLLNNPTDVGQNVSDFTFTLSSGTFANLNTTSTPTGTLIEISSHAASADPTDAIKPYQLTSSGKSITLEGLFGSGGSGPSQTIIGPGPYTNANGSINGNGPHNPFLAGNVTFTITGLTGVTADTKVTAATFSFGTTPGVDVAGVVTATPEPTTGVLLLSGLALVAVGSVRKKTRQ